MTVYDNISSLTPAKWLRIVLIISFLILLLSPIYAQQREVAATRFSSGSAAKDTYGLFQGFIENKGQYGKTVKGVEPMGTVLYA